MVDRIAAAAPSVGECNLSYEGLCRGRLIQRLLKPKQGLKKAMQEHAAPIGRVVVVLASSAVAPPPHSLRRRAPTWVRSISEPR
jgi:hypothetical protein